MQYFMTVNARTGESHVYGVENTPPAPKPKPNDPHPTRCACDECAARAWSAHKARKNLPPEDRERLAREEYRRAVDAYRAEPTEARGLLVELAEEDHRAAVRARAKADAERVRRADWIRPLDEALYGDD